MEFFNFVPGGKVPSVVSAKTLWRLVGCFALFLPLALWLGNLLPGGCRSVQDSISAYYYTNMRNVFVGVLCAVSLFLFAYNGYEKIDAILSKCASVFALGIAFCPTTYDSAVPMCFVGPVNTNRIIGALHYVSAGAFFGIISSMSLFLFTRTHKGRSLKSATPGKKRRNAVYRVCGIVMIVSLLLIVLYTKWLVKYFQVPSLTFYLESIVLVAFGISWTVKGRTVNAVARMIGLAPARAGRED